MLFAEIESKFSCIKLYVICLKRCICGIALFLLDFFMLDFLRNLCFSRTVAKFMLEIRRFLRLYSSIMLYMQKFFSRTLMKMSVLRSRKNLDRSLWILVKVSQTRFVQAGLFFSFYLSLLMLPVVTTSFISCALLCNCLRKLAN